MGSQDSTRARGSWVLGALLGLALPAFADDERPELCRQLVSLADAARDGAVHQVRIIWRPRGERPACGGDGAAERTFCQWLAKEQSGEYLVRFSQTALSCLGLDPEPSDDPDPNAFATGAWWTRGGFEAESGPLARDHLEFAMDMSIGNNDGPWWILFTARPK